MPKPMTDDEKRALATKLLSETKRGPGQPPSADPAITVPFRLLKSDVERFTAVAEQRGIKPRELFTQMVKRLKG